MSLKEVYMDIFTQYGLLEDEIKVYIGYLGMPQATVSQIASLLEMENDTVNQITAKLEELKFIKKIEGKVDRYIPLEPYFSLFTGQSKNFRDDISVIKDNVLADQSAKYDELDGIATDAKTHVENTVADTQSQFNSDANDQETVATATITKARDRFEETSKKLELEIHQTLDKNYDLFKNDCNELESEMAAKWTAHSSKFTSDNESLNEKLTELRDRMKSESDDLEKSVHQILDALNNQAIDHTTNAKNEINKLIDDLLADFDSRLKALDSEIKSQLDEHVSAHKEHAEGLKPRLDEILQKYMDRMNDAVETLKAKISKLLGDHIDHLKATTDKMQDDLTSMLSTKQETYVSRVRDFEDKTKLLIDNLIEITNNLSSVSEKLASRKSAWIALFTGKHNEWKEIYENVKERVMKLGSDIKNQFDKETNQYIEETNNMTVEMNDNIRNILSTENGGLKSETEALDTHAQETVNAELEGLATDLSAETLDTLRTNIQHCSDTTSKLKTSVENSFNSHQTNFNTALNEHRNGVLNFNDDFRSKFDTDVNTCKSDVSADIAKKKETVDKYHADATSQHTEHANIFKDDTEEMKEKQANMFKDRLEKVLNDKDGDKVKTSNLIDEQIGLFKSECKEMNSNLLAMLDDHKDRFKEVSSSMEEDTKNTIDETIQKIKDSIAEFSLQFMNKIDDAFEIAEKNEEKLTEIHNAAHSVRPVEPILTWHIIGKAALITYLKDVIKRTKSSIIIVTPEPEPEILQEIAEVAMERRAQKFFLTTHWDLSQYAEILKKLNELGNVQFRQLKTTGEYWAITRDAEEIMLAPNAKKDTDMVCIVSEQDGYAKLYSQFIGPLFQAQSSPLRL
ncbi:MAG: helix-turn-helix domain-containing protein [Promethearchaeota archaeon]